MREVVAYLLPIHLYIRYFCSALSSRGEVGENPFYHLKGPSHQIKFAWMVVWLNRLLLGDGTLDAAPLIFFGPFKFLCDPHKMVTNSYFLWRVLTLAGSHLYMPVYSRSGCSPGLYRKSDNAVIFSYQHWQISPVASLASVKLAGLLS